MGKLIAAQALAAGSKQRRVRYLHEPPCSNDAKVTFPQSFLDCVEGVPEAGPCPDC